MRSKSCIITGAANGVGLAVARRFAEAGAQVVLADIDDSKVQLEADALAKDGYAAISFAGDMTERLAVANLLSTTIDAYDKVDVLINAARTVETAQPMEITADDLTRLFAQNVSTNLHLVQAVARKMSENNKELGVQESAGVIVNVSSIAASRTLPELTGYSVTCAALDQLTRSLAVALAAQQIRVNAIAIGSIMSTSLQESLKADETLRERVTSTTPAGRIGETEEAAEAALFLASEAASFITGQILAVDGGRSLVDPMFRPQEPAG